QGTRPLCGSCVTAPEGSLKPPRRRRSSGERQVDPERRAGARLDDVDVPAGASRDAECERETEPGALPAPLACLAAASGLEDHRPFLRRDTGAVVRDQHLCHVAVGTQAYLDVGAPVLAGVLEQRMEDAL